MSEDQYTTTTTGDLAPDLGAMSGDSVLSGPLRQLPPLPPARYLELLRQIGKRDTYDEVRARALWMAPFEIRQALNPGEMGTAVEARIARVVPTLEGWRNALVVVPLMLTWFALGLAAVAYQQYVQTLSAKVTPVSFFQEWQLGFPGLTTVRVLRSTIPLTFLGSRFTFAHVAILDFLILALLLLLTALAQLIEAHAYRAGVRFAAWFDNHTFAMMKASHLFSADPNEKDKPSWYYAVEDAVYKLTRAVDGVSGVQEAAAKLTGIYQLVSEVYDKLGIMLPTMKEEVTQLVQTQQLSQQDWRLLVHNLNLVVQNIAAVAAHLDPSQAYRMQEAYAAAYAQPMGRRPGFRQRITSIPRRIFRHTGGNSQGRR